jgi:hypothetical protein
MERPTHFSDDVAGAICARLMDGESLRSICSDPEMPSGTTVFRWLGDDRYSSFREQYARAREAQADAIADEILDIVDDGRNDWMEKLDKDGKPIGWQLNGEAVMRSKLRADSRKWLASKLLPRKYGEKLDVTTGGDKLPPPTSSLAIQVAALLHSVQERAQIEQQENDDGND